jgi:hypothetical protein
MIKTNTEILFHGIRFVQCLKDNAARPEETSIKPISMGHIVPDKANMNITKNMEACDYFAPSQPFQVEDTAGSFPNQNSSKTWGFT